VSPEVTIERLRGLLPLFGITRVANVTGLDSVGIPVVMVCRPNSRCLAVSQGKGKDLACAKASGLMESVESFHGERVQLPLTLGSFNEVRWSHTVADLDRLPRPAYSRYHPDLRTLWIEGRDLATGESRLLPFETVHTDFRLPFPTGSGAFFQSTSGLASGNHALEAISHGICELVERDASTLWHESGESAQCERRVDLKTVDDAACLEILDLYHSAGIAVGVWETTTDVKLASFDCLIVDRELDPRRPLAAAFGAGCHVAREVALSRALTEAAQSRLTAISGSRDDMDRRHHERSQFWDTLRAAHAFIAGVQGRRRFQEAPTYETNSVEEDVAIEMECLRCARIGQVVVVDLTKPELGIPVVKVVAPGLEFPNRMPGYTPGERARAARAAGVRP
jgi:ribosomal protein S12 methylthiotransferase accessory factor